MLKNPVSFGNGIFLYKDFQIIVKTNPNGGITSEAKVIAGTLNIEICTWGDFLGKLNTFWN